ncbi:MAG TPA: lamin tail domain-containing protein, partial [Chryseosolibacter sp.]
MGENIFSKSIPVFVLLWSFMTQQALGQIADNFADGNLTSDPAWAGSTANYIVNGSGRLQLNAPVAGSSFLSLPFSIPTNHNTQWEFVIAHNFSASTQNLTRVYLMSDTQDPLAIQNGYFLQFGETGSNDPIDLFKVTGGNASSTFRGTLGFVAAPFNIRVRVTRSSTGTWEIFADNMAVSNFTSQGSVVDNTVQASSFFILRSTYTIGNISNFSYDDFVITTTPAPDVTAPGINSVSVLSASEINLNFSEALDATSPLNASQFVLNDTIAANAAAYAENNTTIQLTFPQAMVNGRIQKIQFPSVSDLSANVLASGHQNFLFFQPVDPQPHDLIINEIYADPSPSIGLPEFEFVEIYNRSQHPFQLENWQLTDGTTTATLSAKILLPGEFLTVTPNAASAAFSGLGPTMGVTTFPSLNNSGDNLQLKSPDGIEIDAQPYALAWYHDEDKDAGGFSLERIDPTSFCKGADNWRASSHAIGGTPGHQNSAWQITPDVTGPRLLEVIPKTSKVITLKFDERMDATLPQLSNFNFSADVAKTTANFTNAALTDIDLEFGADLDSTVVYTVTLSGFFDCPGNALQSSASSASFKMDMVKPTIVSLAVLNQTQIQLNFSEKLLSASVSTASFSLEQNAPVFSFGQSADRKSVVLTFAAQLTNGKEYTMTVRQLSDDAANVMIEDHRTFRFFQPIAAAAKDVVINEFLADQSPIVGLPEGEFIEIYNRSNKPFNLSGWKITDGSSTGTLPDKIILPDQYFILCPVSLASQYQNFGTALALSTFPSLNNSGDQIKLTDPWGLTIDSIQYSSAWYQDDDKEDGGWAIERINPNDFCGETENWKAGENPLGGTPGTVNSVFALTEDKISPDLVSVSVIRSDSLVVHFSERLSASTRSQTNFVFEPELQIQKLDFTALDRRHIAFKLSTSLDSTTQYQLRAQQIFDCPGNLIHPDSTHIAFKLDNVAPVVTGVLTNSPTRVTIAFSER